VDLIKDTKLNQIFMNLKHPIPSFNFSVDQRAAQLPIEVYKQQKREYYVSLQLIQYQLSIV